MDIAVIMLSVFVLVIIAHMRTPRSEDKMENINTIEVLPAHKMIEIEVIDEMTKEKVRNLYEEQDVCNAKISYLIRQNKQYEREISILDERMQKNLDEMRMQAIAHPGINMQILKDTYESSNQNLYKHKLKYEGIMLTNAERIVSYKKKSNSISEQITKIGKEIYEKQRQM